MSPYVYCVGNPVKYVDPDGRDLYKASDESILWTDCTSQEEINDEGHLGAVSSGCLLIVPSRKGINIGWDEFNQQLSGVKRFTLILKRD